MAIDKTAIIYDEDVSLDPISLQYLAVNSRFFQPFVSR